MEADERARLGLFLAMQYPVEVPGVSVMNFLRTSLQAIRGEEISPRDFVKLFDAKSKLLGFDRAFADRYLNEGFSGGEKKRHEILQMAMIEPRFAVLDETDSGLDVDALKVVSERRQRHARPGPRRPHHHPLHADPALHHAGRRARDVRGAHRQAPGGPELAEHLEENGYVEFGAAEEAAAPDGVVMSTAAAIDVRRSGPTSRSSGGRCTARRSSTSTRRPRRRSRPPCSTRWRPTTARPTPTSTAASTSWPPRRPTRFEARPRRGGPPRRRAARGRDLHQERQRGDQPGGLGLGRPQAAAPATRCSSPRWSTTRTSSRGRSSPRSPAPRCVSRPSRPAASSTWTRSAACSSGATRMVAVAHASNVLGTINPVAEIARLAHERRRPLPGGRLPERPPHAGRRPGARLRLLRVHRPQDARPHRDRRAWWASWTMLEGMEPFLGGGEMISDVTTAGSHLGRAALEVRGRDARRSPRPWAWAPPPSTCRAVGIDAVRAHEVELTGHMLDALARGGRHHRLRAERPARPAAAPSRSACPTSTRTTSPSSSTARASASGPATTAPSRSCACSAWAPRPARAPISTIPTTTSTRSCAPWGTRGPCSGRSGTWAGSTTSTRS